VIQRMAGLKARSQQRSLEVCLEIGMPIVGDTKAEGNFFVSKSFCTVCFFEAPGLTA